LLIAKCGKLGIKERNMSKTEPNNQESCISGCWKNERISKNSQIFWGKQIPGIISGRSILPPAFQGNNNRQQDHIMLINKSNITQI
jgi:hypothetical protein